MPRSELKTPSVVNEVKHRMRNYTKTAYGHSFQVDLPDGTGRNYYRLDHLSGKSYEYDCCGFACHVLGKTHHQAYKELRSWAGIQDEPKKCVGTLGAKNWKTFAKMVADKQVPPGTWKHWQAVRYVNAQAATRSLRAGDILVKYGDEHMHVMIAMGRPTETERDGWSLKIADSTNVEGGHGPNDTRHTGSRHRHSNRNSGRGMGTGYIRVRSGMRMTWGLNTPDDQSKSILAIRPKKCKGRHCPFCPRT